MFVFTPDACTDPHNVIFSGIQRSPALTAIPSRANPVPACQALVCTLASLMGNNGGMTNSASAPPPSERTLRRWRKNLAEERAEHAVYRYLASRRSGEEREILLALAEAEKRHELHWLNLLGDHVGPPQSPSWRTRLLAFLARHFGFVFALALMQYSENRLGYQSERDATSQMAADEAVHGEVIRALAARGRASLSGTFRAAIFGANDGLVSNLALVAGMGATGVSATVVLLTGISGLLAGALSMAAGEYVSVRSQRELLEAAQPAPGADAALGDLDMEANELELVYRARGMDPEQAQIKAQQILGMIAQRKTVRLAEGVKDASYREVGTAWRAATSSFIFFASGAIIPVIPYIFGMSGVGAMALAAALVGLALIFTGAIVGVLSGTSPAPRAARQLAIGYGAAAITIGLGALFGTTLT